MARRVTEDQLITAYQLYRTGQPRQGPAAIARKLDLLYENPVTEQTVKRWCKQFAEIVEDDPELDVPFQWHRLDEFGLPWEASQYLFIVHTQHQAFSKLPPTFRQARWWWRIHQAAPDLEEFDVWAIAEHFTLRELEHRLLAHEAAFADLEAWLIYKPWAGKACLRAYLADTKNGRIPKLRDPKTSIESRAQIDKLRERKDTDSDWGAVFLPHVIAPSSTFPKYLPSDRFKVMPTAFRLAFGQPDRSRARKRKEGKS